MSVEHLIRLHLELMVPLRIRLLQQTVGRPSEDDLRQAANEFRLWSSEAVMFREPGQSARAVSELATVLALLAFAPGGVEFMGLRFEVKDQE